MLAHGASADVSPTAEPCGPIYTLLDAAMTGADGVLQLTDDRCRALYRDMLTVRLVDDRMMQLRAEGRIGFYASARGEEAAQLGAVFPLRGTDWIFPSHRDATVAFSRGYSLIDYVSQLFGNASDPTKGRQMPVHHSMKAIHCVSISSPVGTQLSQAVGMATAARIRKKDDIALTFFGEGTTSSGEFHVGLNFAGVWKAPVVFLCKNGGEGATTKQTAASSYAIKGTTYGVRAIRVDGSDVLAVISAVDRAVTRARGGEGPTLIEAVVQRGAEDPTRDPLLRWKKYLEHRGLWTQALHDVHAASIETELTQVIAQAEKTAAPALATLFDDVYAELTSKLVEQKEQLLAGPRAPRQHG